MQFTVKLQEKSGSLGLFKDVPQPHRYRLIFDLTEPDINAAAQPCKTEAPETGDRHYIMVGGLCKSIKTALDFRAETFFF